MLASSDCHMSSDYLAEGSTETLQPRCCEHEAESMAERTWLVKTLGQHIHQIEALLTAQTEQVIVAVVQRLRETQGPCCTQGPPPMPKVHAPRSVHFDAVVLEDAHEVQDYPSHSADSTGLSTLPDEEGKVANMQETASFTDAEGVDESAPRLSFVPPLAMRESTVVDTSAASLFRQSWVRAPMKDQSWQAWLEAWLRSNICESLVSILIVANAAMFGIQVDHGVKHPETPAPYMFKAADTAFACLFSVELLVRMLANGKNFVACANPDLAWNLLDSFLVLLGILEEIIRIVGKSMLDVSSARILRLLRLSRIVRIVRVFRFFKDLRVMVGGIMSSMKALMWAMLLLIIIMYVVAVCLLQMVSDWLVSENAAGVVEITFSENSAAHQYFSSLLKTMYTLYMSISGGLSWHDAAKPLQVIHPLLPVLYSAYVAFALFCVLNIVTGVFVERSTSMALHDEENLLFTEIERRQKRQAEVESLFRKADLNGDGCIEWDEFKHAMANLRVQALLKGAGIDLERVNIKQIWKLMDFDNSSSLDIAEFTSGLQQLHGVAHSIDIVRLRHDLIKQHNSLVSLTELCKSTASSLKSIQAEIQFQIQAQSRPRQEVTAQIRAKGAAPAQAECRVEL
eukprot:gb/GFBE01079787.1/.p1 GENE.gb/GFBE01079787.1/~~gb/GFBE01079787.1/.p1  ORF type:complete len:626 (+),score=118.51 gb/GFBE01079787.1/:1-1878(+)